MTARKSKVPPGEGEWRAVEGYGDRYLVSAEGVVWGAYYSKPLVGVVQRHGHIRVTLTDQQHAKAWRGVHQLVMEAFVGRCPIGHEVRHLDGRPENNALENLAYGTKSENARDRRRHGTDANARKTHCKRGHPFDELNTRWRPDGPRKCRACDRARHA